MFNYLVKIKLKLIKLSYKTCHEWYVVVMFLGSGDT